MRITWVLLLASISIPVYAQESADALSAPSESEGSVPAEQPSKSVLSMEVFAGTTAPLDVGVGVNVVLWERLFFTTSVGVSVYRRTIDAVAQGLGGDETADIATPLLFGATVVRLGVGLRPFGNGGPEVVGGYLRLMGDATWDAGSFGVPARFGEISASVAINAFYAELGWAISMGPVFIRPALGVTRALGSRVSVDASGASSAQSATVNSLAGEAVSDALDEFGVTPTVSLSIGGRFSLHRR